MSAQLETIEFYCIVCKTLVERSEFVASVDIGGWVCAFHSTEEIEAVKNNGVVLSRLGRVYEVTSEGLIPK